MASEYGVNCYIQRALIIFRERNEEMRLVILGAGGYGHTVADVAIQLGYDCVFLDDSIPNHQLSCYRNYIDDNTEFIPAFGNNSFRLNWIDKLQSANAKIAILIHPSSYISPKAVIKEGTVILPKAVVNTDSVVDKGCIINLGAIVDHGCIIEAGCHICLGAIVKGENRIKRLTKIEAGEVIEARKYKI